MFAGSGAVLCASAPGSTARQTRHRARTAACPAPGMARLGRHRTTGFISVGCLGTTGFISLRWNFLLVMSEFTAQLSINLLLAETPL